MKKLTLRSWTRYSLMVVSMAMIQSNAFLYAEDWTSEEEFRSGAAEKLTQAQDALNNALTKINEATDALAIKGALQSLTLPESPHATEKFNIYRIEKTGGGPVEGFVSIFGKKTEKETPFQDTLRNTLRNINDLCDAIKTKSKVIMFNAMMEVGIPLQLDQLKANIENFITVFVQSSDKLEKHVHKTHKRYRSVLESIERLKNMITGRLRDNDHEKERESKDQE